MRLRAGNADYVATVRGSTTQLDSASVITIRSASNLICDGDAQGVYLEGGGQSVAVSDIERVPDAGPTASLAPGYAPGPLGIRQH